MVLANSGSPLRAEGIPPAGSKTPDKKPDMQAEKVMQVWQGVITAKERSDPKFDVWVALLVERAKDISQKMGKDKDGGEDKDGGRNKDGGEDKEEEDKDGGKDKDGTGAWKEEYNELWQGLGDTLEKYLQAVEHSQSVPTVLHALTLGLSDRILQARRCRGNSKSHTNEPCLTIMELAAARKYVKNRENLLRYMLRDNRQKTLYSSSQQQQQPQQQELNVSAQSKAKSKGADKTEDRDAENDSSDEFANLALNDTKWVRGLGNKQSYQSGYTGKRADSPLELALAPLALGPLLQLFVEEAVDETVAQLESWIAEDNQYQGPAKGDWIHALVSSICDAAFPSNRDIDNQQSRDKSAKAGLTALEKLLLHEKFAGGKNSIYKIRDEKGNTILHLISRANVPVNLVSSYKTLIDKLVGRWPKALEARNKFQESPYLHRVNTAASLKSSASVKGGGITSHLKLLSIRCDPHRTAQLLLFGTHIKNTKNC